MKKLSVCVYCGSRAGNLPAYEDQAQALGLALAKAEWRLVYGAGNIGLMGAVANAVQKAGGETLGVIPTHLVKAEVGKTHITQYIITENMHERKKVMFMNSDAIVIMPGGAGSLDEFFEVLTWAQLGLHKKPIIIMNVAQYWDPLIALIDHSIESGFADASLRQFFVVTKSGQETMDHIARLAL